MSAPVIPWHRDKLMAFDLETSGVDPFNDRIITASVVQVRPGARPTILQWIVNPGIEIPTQASDIHGWTTQRLASCPQVVPVEQALFEIGSALAYPLLHNIPLIVFNAPYDLTMYDAECRRHQAPTLQDRLGHPVRPVIDPMVIDKQLSRRKGKRRLTDCCTHYGVLHGGAHDAAADALAALRLVPLLVEKYKRDIGHTTPDVLHDLQVGWKTEQAVSFTKYLQEQGKPPDDVSGDWPTRQPALVEQGVLT